MTTTVAEAQQLVDLVERAVRYSSSPHYTGYPMMRQARRHDRQGELGDIRVVQAEYARTGLPSAPSFREASRPSGRTDPRVGAGGCIGDIGTHATNLVVRSPDWRQMHCWPSLTPSCWPPARRHVQIVLRYKGGGAWHAVGEPGGVGHENALKLRITAQGRAGMDAGRPELSVVHPLRQPKQLLTALALGALPEAPASLACR